MDVSMLEMSGLEATAEIRNSRPHILIVGLSMHDDPDTEKRIIKAGATAYLYNASPAKKLMETIRNNLL